MSITQLYITGVSPLAKAVTGVHTHIRDMTAVDRAQHRYTRKQIVDAALVVLGQNNIIIQNADFEVSMTIAPITRDTFNNALTAIQQLGLGLMGSIFVDPDTYIIV